MTGKMLCHFLLCHFFAKSRQSEKAIHPLAEPTQFRPRCCCIHQLVQA
jgi:hypothetical protein